MLFNALFIGYWLAAGYAIYRLTVYLQSDRQDNAAKRIARALEAIPRPELETDQSLEDWRNRQDEIAQSFDL